MAKQKTPTATLAVFAWGGLVPETHDCIVRDMRNWPRLHHYRVSGDALIDRARSRAASDFLAADGKDVGNILLMVDHDIVWRDSDLRRLYDSAAKTMGVVGGVYSKRNFGAGIAVRWARSGHYRIGDDCLVPCSDVSGGFMAIHRRVLAKLAEGLPKTVGDFYPFFIPFIGDRGDEPPEEFSEDWAFCRRALQAGFRVDADLYPRLQHVGQWAYRVMDCDTIMPPDSPVTFNVLAAPTSPALATLARDVADFTGISPDGLHKDVGEARRLLAVLWEKHGGFGQEDGWYARPDVGRAYVLDLAGGHLDQLVDAVNVLDQIEGQRVLEFGAGIGTMALALADKNDVTTVEVNPVLNEFVRTRAERMGVELHQADAPQGQYDMVVCWHVLEHLPNPREAARMLAAHIKPGGSLLTDSDFHRDALHPMHMEGFDATDIWREAGLEQLEGVHWRKP